MTVSGIGTVQGVPDTMTASFAVDATKGDVQSALDAVALDAGKVIAALRHAGVPDKDIATNNLSLNPSYDNNGHVNGYSSEEDIVATLTPLAHAGTILSAAAGAAGNAGRVEGLSLSIGDDSSLLSQARTAAFDDAQAKAQQYAGLSHASLGKVLSVSETVSNDTTPVPAAEDLAGASAAPAAVPVQAGQQPEQVTVTVTWSLA